MPTVIIGNKNDQPKNSKFETFLPSVWAHREKCRRLFVNSIISVTLFYFS